MDSHLNIPDWLDGERRLICNTPETGDFHPSDEETSFPRYLSATNAEERVIDLIRPIVMGDECLIVTGYQDFLSALSIILEVRPGITHAAPGTIRLLLGTNTDNLRFLASSRQPLPDHVRRHYMAQTGVFVRDMRDLNAVRAREAIRSGAIQIRVFDEAIAQAKLGYYPGMMHANLFVSEDFAAAGSATFSRSGLASNVEFVDRLLNGFDAHSERQKAGERFWEWGRDWQDAALELLGGLVRPVRAETAAARIAYGMMNFAPWRPEAGSDEATAPTEQERTLSYVAAQAVYEYGLAYLALPGSVRQSVIGRIAGRAIADMYERCVMRDDDATGRKQGALAIVAPAARMSWRQGQRSPVRVLPRPTSGAVPAEDILQDLETASVFLLDRVHDLKSRHLSGAPMEPLLERAAPCWTVGLGAALPVDCQTNAILGFLESRGFGYLGPALCRDIASDLRIVSPPPGRKSRRKTSEVDAARQHLAEIVAPLAPALHDHGKTPDMRPVPMVLDKATAKAVATLRAALEDMRQRLIEHSRISTRDLREADQLHRDLADLWALCTESIAAAQEAWNGPLGARLRVIDAGPVETGAENQGMLPMFVEEKPSPSRSPAGLPLTSALSSTDMGKACTSRLTSLSRLLSDHRRVIVATRGEASARHIVEALGRLGVEHACTLSASDPLERREEIEDRFSSASRRSSADRIVLVADLDVIRDARFLLAEAVVIFGPGRSFSDLVEILDLAGRTNAGEGAALYAVTTPGLLPVADAKGLDKIRRATLEGDGAFPPELLDLRHALDSLGDKTSTPAITLPAILSSLAAGATVKGAAEADEVVSGWGADIATVPSQAGPFTAFYLAGKTGRYGEAFMPPRLIVVRDLPEGGEVVRSQAAAALILEKAFTQARNSRSGAPEVDAGLLEVVSRHLASLTHWDLRAERVASLLGLLGEFLNEPPLPCSGQTLFGDLTLPSLELVADRWARHLGEAWSRIKPALREHWELRGYAEEFLSPARLLEVFQDRPVWELRAIRSEMTELVADLRFRDRNRSKTLQDRVAVIVRGLPIRS